MEYLICSTSHKRCYQKKDAQYTVNLANKKHWKNRPSKIPKRIYYCNDCGYYHLTKEVVYNEGRDKRKARARRYTDERKRLKRMDADIHRYTREYR